MEKVKVLDENNNVVFLDRISVKGQYRIPPHEISNSAIDSISYAKRIISKKIAEEMENNLFFTERIMPDGSIIIESATYFYGQLNKK